MAPDVEPQARHAAALALEWPQLEALARLWQPVYELLRLYILGDDVVGVDETWWRLLDGSSRPTQGDIRRASRSFELRAQARAGS